MRNSTRSRRRGRWRTFHDVILPPALWTRRFAVAWAGCFFTFMAFDLIWCMATNYRPMGFVSTYLFPATLSLVMALPALTCRRRWPMLVVLLIADIWLEANIMYCRTYFEAIPPSSYLLAGNAAEFGGPMLSYTRWFDLVLPLIAILTVALMGKRRRESFPRGEYLVTITIAVAACVLCALFHGGISRHIAQCKNECYKHAFPPVLYTLPCSFVSDLTETVAPVSETEKKFASEYLAKRFSDAAKEASDTTAAARPQRQSLVFIIVESLEAWPINKKVEGQEITPNLNRWLRDSTTWFARRVCSQVGQGRSVDGQLLITTGLWPTSKYVWSMRYTSSTFPSLAKEMKHYNGAKPYLLSGARANSWNQGVAAAACGIDTRMYRDKWDDSESFTKPRNPSDKSFFRQVEERMRSGEIWPEGEKAFLEVFTYSAHTPFNIPPEHRTIDLRNSYPEPLDRYIQAINYTDGALGQLVKYLQSRSDWPETMVVIVGDHEGLATARKTILEAPGRWGRLVDEGQYVPMVVLNSPVAGRMDNEMGQVDVYSTILDLMGITPVWPGLGYSALSPLFPGYSPDDPSGAMQRAGSAIIAADMLNGRLKY